jgi:transporter family protein
MKDLALAWQIWAGLAAIFAALTAIFAKIGVADVGPEFATFVRTIIILPALAAILTVTRGWQAPAPIPARAGVFLILSGLATGASWVCCFRALKLGDAARVAPIDKLSGVLVAIFAVIFLGEKLAALNWLGIVLIATGALLVAF